MKTLVSILLVLVFVVNAKGQSRRFREHLDSVEVHENQYLKDYNWKSFFESGLANEKLVLTELDEDLLNATLFFSINKLRKKKRRKELVYSQELNKCAMAYANFNRSNSFKRTKNNIRKSEKCIRYASKKYGYHGTYIKTVVSKPLMLDIHRLADFYRDKKVSDEEDDLALFLGKRPNHQDSTAKIEPVEVYTYESFAMKLAKEWFWGNNSKTSKNRAFTVASCYVVLDKRTMFKSKIPNAKAIFILGGKRTEMLPDEPMITSKE